MNGNGRYPQGQPYNRGNPTGRPTSTPAQHPIQNPNRRPPQKKKKIRFKPNKEGMQALVILVLIVALVITLLVLTIKGIANAIGGANEETTESTTEASTTEAPPAPKWYDDYVKQVFFGSYENAEVINSAVEKHLTGWKKERISPVSMALIRLGAYEIMFMEDIPSKVSINEAVELAKKYDDEKSYSFVNGVLNALAAEYAGK